MQLTSLAVQSLGKLVDCRGDLQTLVEDGALPLQANVTRPLDKARQVTLWLNVLACKCKNSLKTSNHCKNAEPSAFQLEVHQRSWWDIVISSIKIANIQLHHMHFPFFLIPEEHLPMPKFFGLFSNRGLTTFLASCFLATEGAGATFFPLAFFPLGCQEKGCHLVKSLLLIKGKQMNKDHLYQVKRRKWSIV